MTETFDLAVVGAGIVGLAHVLAAARQGRKVVVIERDARAAGASVRNFGFVTITGQQRGRHWQRALRSREVWAEVAPQARIDVIQRGLLMLARRPEAAAVLEAFAATEMGESCRLLSAQELRSHHPELNPNPLSLALHSPHELRVESRDALPRLAAWLEERWGVAFRWSTAVRGVDLPRLETDRGPVFAEAAVVCPNADLTTLFAEELAGYRLKPCKLHMLRVDPPAGYRLPAPVMSDLSLVRYEGYSALAEAAPLRERLLREQGDALSHGIHLIAVQSADGSLVVGDSHHYDDPPSPFQSEAVDRLILEELTAVTGLQGCSVRERWTGVYPSSDERVVLVEAPREDLRIVIVTGGTGASTAFALGEEVIAGLLGPAGSEAVAPDAAISGGADSGKGAVAEKGAVA
ncbi:MAG TPA: TIGR03364 family FAD-dependent oxidoreductase [Kiloniellaceae bacterium]|nr:TIGR03364 family FAD-dependent oxidoreductase [Kiloniellaceae bacterium]